MVFKARDAARMQHHEEMVEKIGAFIDERLTFASHGGDHRLDRLFAHFLGGAGRAAVEQRFGVRGFRARACPFGNDRGEIGQAEIAHDGPR